MACRLLDTAPNEVIAASMLSLPIFCTSSIFLTIMDPFRPHRPLIGCCGMARFKPTICQPQPPIYCTAQKCQGSYCDATSEPLAGLFLTVWQWASPSVIDCAVAATAVPGEIRGNRPKPETGQRDTRGAFPKIAFIDRFSGSAKSREIIGVSAFQANACSKDGGIRC